MKIYIAKADDDNGEVSFGKLDEDIYNCQEEINEKISELLYISANDMEEVS